MPTKHGMSLDEAWQLPSKALRNKWRDEVTRYLGEQEWQMSPVSMDNTIEIMPWFYHNDLEFVGNPWVKAKVLAAIVETVVLAEQQVQKEFGGFIPQSNEFGIAPLRMFHLDWLSAATSGPTEWKWTDASESSINWSSTDTFVNSFQLGTSELAMVYGYFNLEANPNTVELAMEPGSVKFPIWQIGPLQIKRDPYIIFPECFILETQSQFAIGASTRSGVGATTERAGLLGYFFAPQSTLLKKRA